MLEAPGFFFWNMGLLTPNSLSVLPYGGGTPFDPDGILRANGSIQNQSSEGMREFISLAKKRFKRSAEAEIKNRMRALEAIRFIIGEQWPADLKAKRKAKKRPCLTINLLKKFVKQVVNEIRASRPSVRVSPIDDFADVDTAKIIQGLVRNIERNSMAEVAYDTAAEYAAMGGFGYLRLLTQFVDDDSFDQELAVKTIMNPFAVYGDPDGEEVDGSDWNFAFITNDVATEEYKREYPDSEMAGLADFSGIGDREYWTGQDTIRVAEYYYVEKSKTKLYRLWDGVQEISADAETKQTIEQLAASAGLPAPQVIGEREKEKRTVRWCKINAVEILEGNEDKTAGKLVPGSHVPIVRVLGDAYSVDGELCLYGMTEDSHDSQRMVNYMASYLVETVALAPKAPNIIAEGQIEGHEKEWREANVEQLAALVYKEKSLEGRMVPPPFRNVAEPPIGALTQALVMFTEQIKGTLGLYGPSIGEPSGEKTGIAIRERKQQGNVATFHFGDNLGRAMHRLGKYMVEDIPAVYNRPGRIERIIGEDDTERTVTLNKPFTEETESHRKIRRLYDVGVGKYDVDVYMGPSFASKRQEAADSQLRMAQTFPQMMQYAGDIVIGNQDWSGAKDIAERIKRTIPAEIREGPPQEGEEQQIPPVVQQQMEQLSQAVEQLSAVLDEQSEIIKTKKIETESTERIESLKIQAGLIKTQAELATKEGLVEMQGQVDALLKRLDHLYASETKEKAPELETAGAKG
jgi:hypothetical protein